MAYVEYLISSGAIRLFDSSGVAVDSFSDFIDDPSLIADAAEAASTVAALNLLAAHSSEFVNILSKLSSTNSLWIDLARTRTGLVETFIEWSPQQIESNPRIANSVGLISSEPTVSATMIAANGEIVALSYARILAHEISHAIDDTRDPQASLAGLVATPRSAYLGRGCRVRKSGCEPNGSRGDLYGRPSDKLSFCIGW